MVNGPPTPPPASATEFRDETRGSVSSIADTSIMGSVPSDPTKHDEFHQNFPVIAELAMRKQYQELIRTAESADLNAKGDYQQTRSLVIAPLALAYLILDDSPSARYVLGRIPDVLARLPLPKLLMALTGSIMNRHHGRVYQLAKEILTITSQPGFLDKMFAVVIEGMVATLIEAFRQRAFVLLSKAYTSLPLSLACVYLGLPPEQILAVAESGRWHYDPVAMTMTPPVAEKSSFCHATASSSLATFHFVANSVAKLET